MKQELLNIAFRKITINVLVLIISPVRGASFNFYITIVGTRKLNVPKLILIYKVIVKSNF